MGILPDLIAANNYASKYKNMRMVVVEVPVKIFDSDHTLYNAVMEACCIYCGHKDRIHCIDYCWDINWEIKQMIMRREFSTLKNNNMFSAHNSPPKDLLTEF